MRGDDAQSTAPLRFALIWQMLGWLLVAFVVYESLTSHPIDISLEHGDKYGHVLAYATLMVWFAQIHTRTQARLALAAMFVVLGIGLEFAQRATGYRAFEVADMVADAVGVGVGWLAAPPRLPNVLRLAETRLPG